MDILVKIKNKLLLNVNNNNYNDNNNDNFYIQNRKYNLLQLMMKVDSSIGDRNVQDLQIIRYSSPILKRKREKKILVKYM